MKLSIKTKIGLGVFVVVLVAAVITLLVLTVKSGSAANNPSGLSSDGQYAVGQRRSDGKWQIIYVQKTATAYQGLYQILYNPQTSTDASMTAFATSDLANDYKVSSWMQSATTTNKALTPLSINTASTDYSNLAAAKADFFSPSR